MFVVLVEFNVKDASASEFLVAVKKQARDSLARESDCFRFDVCTDPESPAVIVLYEIYANAAAFDEHLKTEHFINFDRTTKHMVAKKQVRTLTLQKDEGA